MARGQDPAHQPEVSPLPCGRVCWWGMHTHRVTQGRFPYCSDPSGLSPGGRKRGRGACHTVTRAQRRRRPLGVPLGHLPIGWVTLVLSGERRYFRRRAWVWVEASASWRAWPCGLSLLGEMAQGFLFPGANYRVSTLICAPRWAQLLAGSPHFISTNPTHFFKPTLRFPNHFFYIWGQRFNLI